MQKRTLPVRIGDGTYPITSDDQYLDYVATGFEPRTVELLSSLVSGEHRVLDVGANIGCTAILFGSLAREVHAFEPSTSTCELLRQNVSASGLQNIHVNNFGLGESDYEAEVSFSPNNRSGGFISNRTAATSAHTVERVSIRALDGWSSTAHLQSVDFIKIDVEGFEGHVLRGARNTLARFSPAVVLELNHWCLNAFQRTSVPDFFDYLRSVFPHLYAVDDESAMRADLHDPDSSYRVMYDHILHLKWANIVGAFHAPQVEKFAQVYRPLSQGRQGGKPRT